MKLFSRKARSEVADRAVGSALRPVPKFDTEAEANLDNRQNRLVVVGLTFALAFTVIAVRLVDLAVFESRDGGFSLARGEKQVAPRRYDVVDRNGVILATDLVTASLFAEPRRVLDPAVAAERLNAVLPDIDPEILRKKLASGKGFVWLRRHLTPKQKYTINALGIPGLGFRRDHKRVYPQGPLAAHVVGHTGIDNEGLTGIEKYFDKRLSRRAVESVARPAAGRDADLRLSLDIRAQYVLHRELSAAVEEFSALGAAGVILDIASGEVLAMVSLPDFDLNHAGAASLDSQFNRATLGVYEMGSTFKVFTTAMALDVGTVRINGGYDATKPIRVSRFTIRDDHPKSRWLSVPEIFIYSSNIGAAKMALDVGGKRQSAFLDRLGLLSKSAVELPEVGKPMSPSPWREINTMTVAYGHGVAVSPLQLSSAVASLVNGGFKVKATLLARSRAGANPGKRVLKQRTSSIMRRLMRLNAVRGTGTKAVAPGYLIGGKTGTAEKAGAGGYRRNALLSSFVGAFPMNAPRYVVLAVIDEPKGTKATFGYASGGWTAAPVVGRVIQGVGPILGVSPVDEDNADVQRGMFVQVKSLAKNKRGNKVATF